MKKFLSAFSTLGIAATLLLIASGCSPVLRYDHAKNYAAAASGSASASSLYIEWIAGKVTVDYYEGSEISFSETRSDGGTDDDYTMRYWLDYNFTLRLEYAKSGKRNREGLSKNLTVLVPQGTTLSSIEAETTSASVEISVSAVHCDVETSSGNVTLSNVNALGETDVSTSSGEIALFGAKTAQTGIAGKIDLETSSGSIRAILPSLPRELDAETKSGNIYFTFPDTSFSVRYQTRSGGFSTDFPEKPVNGIMMHTVAGTLPCVCETETRSGSLSVFALD